MWIWFIQNKILVGFYQLAIYSLPIILFYFWHEDEMMILPKSPTNLHMAAEEGT